MRFVFCFSALLAGSLGLPARSPAQALYPAADSLTRQLHRYQQQHLTEELYVHRDRPAYLAGETMWLKLYAVDGTWHRPLALSRVAYVELLDAARRPVLQAKLGMRDALGQGSLALPPDLASGRYTLRAYTSWMKNAGPDYFFQAPVSIVNTGQPQAAGPGAATPAPALDLQFFPEGGQLVQGLPGRLGFKATDALGRGVAVAGTVADGQGQVVARFQTMKAGMGSFALTPLAGATYVATVRLPGGRVLTRPLPPAAARGYALQVSRDSATRQLLVSVRSSAPDVEAVHLLAHTGQHVAVAATGILTGGQATFLVAESRLQPGVTHLTVFSGRRPVAERLYFRRPGHRAAVSVRLAAAGYGLRTRAEVQVQAAGPAALSVAVYRLDSLAASEPVADAAAYLLLAADLPGTVEDAGYYLRDSSATGRRAADNLMLTQGWRRFRWEDVTQPAPPAPTYPPELNGYLLAGRVVQADGTPAAQVPAYLSLPGQAFWFGNAVSRADGRVQFEVPDLYGLRKLVLQTNPARDSAYRVELLSPFVAGGGAPVPPLAPLPVRWATSLSERHLAAQARLAYGEPAPRLLPVPADTIPFYGRAGEAYNLDDYTRFPTLEDVMREYVPAVLVRKRRDGFHFMVTDRARHLNFPNDPLTLLDGLPVFNLNQLMAFSVLKIKRLDVLAGLYLLGSQTYSGVVSFTTYQGDPTGFPLNPRALLEEYEGLQVPREFYSPRYDTPAQQRSRLPDLRNLLYWNPDVRLAAGQPRALEFYTGDQPGRYLVVAQGLSADGQPVSTSTALEVKPAL